MKTTRRLLSLVLAATLLCGTALAASGTWRYSGGGWWYKNAGGSYPADQWEEIDGAWYHFDASGYMQTGWLLDGGTWYYLRPSGAMATGWQRVGGAWYFLGPGGAMKTGWLYRGGSWYYLKPSGAMATGWAKVRGVWYYFDGGGVMQTGWLESGGDLYYLDESGAMVTGTRIIDGAACTFGDDGRLLTTGEPDYMVAYRTVLDRFYNNTWDGWTDFSEEIYYSGENNSAYEYPDSVSYLFYQYGKKGPYETGYALRDLDGNGIPELLVTTSEMAEYGMILDMYSYSDACGLIHLFSSGERSRYYLGEDGSLLYEGSSGAADSTWARYAVDGSRTSLRLIEAVRDYASPDDWTLNWYYTDSEPYDPYDFSAMELITAEEAMAIEDAHEAAAFELTLFGDYAC